MSGRNKDLEKTKEFEHYWAFYLESCKEEGAPEHFLPTTIETNRFESSHGRKPRGAGHWGFIESTKYHRENYLEFVFWAEAQMYGDAKKEARSHFTAMGVTTAYVCP